MCFVRGLARLAPVWACGFALTALMDHRVELAPWGRQLIWILFFGSGLGVFTASFFPLRKFSLKSRASWLSRRTNEFRQDDLDIAVQFGAGQKTDPSIDGTSQELKDTFVEQTAAKLDRCRPWWCYEPWKWRKPVAVSLLLTLVSGSLMAMWPSQFPVSGRVLFPFFSSNVDRFVRVEPGNASVPRGKDVYVRVVCESDSVNRPVVYVRMPDDWMPLEAEQSNGVQQMFRLKSVTQPLSYRVRWQGEWGQKFTLTPIDPVGVKQMIVVLTPPDYTGKSSLTQTNPELSGLAGTLVEMSVEANKPLQQAKLVFSDGKERNATEVKDEVFKIRFAIEESGEYSFSLTTDIGEAGGSDDSYPIHQLKDQSPTIVLLSPEDDLIVDENERIPLTFDVKDDYGVGEIHLIWETSNRKNKRRTIRTFTQTVESAVETYSWDIAQDRFQPGEVIRYKLEVADRNMVTGPGRAETDWHVIEIASFEMKHDEIAKALEVFRDKAVELLAGVNTLKKKTEMESSDVNNLSNEFNPLAQKSADLENLLDRIVSRMEDDPLADYGVSMEHKAMLQSLSTLNQTTVKNTKSAYQTQNKAAAANNLEQIASELERMSALSEELSKTQNAKDVMEAGENIEDAAQQLNDMLESADKIDAETANKINQLMSEAMKNIADIANSLQKMPDELPEDFVNQEALKNLELGKSQDLLSQLQEAMKSGDAKKALALAQQFLKMARKMREDLSKAHESFVKENSADELAKKIQEQSEKLDKVVEEQRKLLAETQKLETKRMESLMKSQEELLAKLAVRQRKAADAARSLSNDERARVEMRALLNAPVNSMYEVALELSEKRVDKTLVALPSVIAQYDAILQEINRSSVTAVNVSEIKRIREEEADILSQLKKPSESQRPVGKEDQEQFKSLQTKQESLEKETQSLKKDIQGLSQKTASMGLPLTQAMSRAGSDMKSASSELGKNSSQSAQKFEESALDNLLQGQAEMQAAQQAMSEMAMEQGGGGGKGSGPKVIMRGGGEGQKGSRNAKVKLPTAEDYKPPTKFREDLLESLKEKYPKIYEKIIHKYYKRLAE